MAAETGFNIDGTLYEVPPLDTFTMDEAQVLYDYSGLTLEDFAPVEKETEEDELARERRLKNPGFLRALMHIAYQRGNRDLSEKKVRDLIGSANVLEAMSGLAGDEEDDASPPELTTAQEKSSPSLPVDKSDSSGTSGESTSTEPVTPPRTIGLGASGTSSPASHPTTSAA